MSRQAELIEITYQVFSLVKLYSRQKGHGLYVPFDQGGQELFLSHSDKDLIPDVLGEGFVVGNASTGEFQLYDSLEDLVLSFLDLDNEEITLLKERLDIAIDTFLSFNLHRNIQAEELLEDLGRAERILPVREGLEQFYLKNKDKLGLSVDFLHKHSEIPEPEEPAFELTLMEEEDE